MHRFSDIFNSTICSYHGAHFYYCYLMEDYPPPYSAPPPAYSNTTPSRIARLPRPRHNLISFLKEYEIVYVIDDSESMGQKDEHSGLIPWQAAHRALKNFASTCEAWGEDGQDLWFLNSHIPIRSATPQDIEAAFSSHLPREKTDMASGLRRVVCGYFERYSRASKPLVIVAITDGALSREIVSAVSWMNRELEKRPSLQDQIIIQLIQIGESRKAAKHREALLDSYDLLPKMEQASKIISTVPWESKRDSFDELYLVKTVSEDFARRWDEYMGRSGGRPRHQRDFLISDL